MTALEILVEGPETWTNIDEQRLAEFLATETGKRVIPRLMEAMPELLSRGETNAIFIRSGEVRGLMLALQTLNLMAHPPKPADGDGKTRGEYPALEDDSAWADGQKLNK